jgi:putative transferase (TIGR04331 family)
LAEVSILHYSPEEAARALNQLWPRVQDWWSREAVQAAREEFVRQFALASPDWVGDWRRELQAIWQ